MNEFELINNFFLKLTKNNKKSLNLNDDVFFDKFKGLVVSVDTYIEGIHFYNFKNPNLVIQKILRASISDLICKGVNPKYYFLSGSGTKKSFTPKNLKKMSDALMKEQKKYNIFLGGGDTVFSNKLSFTVISIGFSKKIIYRNNAKVNDDIYVTDVLGDSFIGLNILKKKMKLNKKVEEYFINKYFLPNLQIKLTSELFKFANTSIDISDGLISDLEKLINKNKVSYKLYLNKIPISRNLSAIIAKKKKEDKLKIISQGDDYQILFTAPPSKSRIVKKSAQSLGLKISKIGKIYDKSIKSSIIDQNGNKISPNYKGYIHQF